MFNLGGNESLRQAWLKKALCGLEEGSRILDAGAGELKNKQYCEHLEYVSQDFCQYKGGSQADKGEGLQNQTWDTSKIDIVCDITSMPVDDGTFDYVLCSEVLEHVPDAVKALGELCRVLKPGGRLILTAPFASLVHMAPYHFASGFSKYWYEYHLKSFGLIIDELTPNGDWFDFAHQEILRLGSQERKAGNYIWPVAYLIGLISLVYSFCRNKKSDPSLACLGWHCIAVKPL